MRMKPLFLLSSIYMGSTLCLAASNLREQIDFSSDMPFDKFSDLYISPAWIDLLLNSSAYNALGALQSPSGDILIENQQNFLVFNQIYQNSCAVRGNTVTIANNHTPIVLYGNVSNMKASAVFADEQLQITQNTAPCLFINNYTHNSALNDFGSAIFGTPVLIENNPGLVLFKNNHCGLVGGAGGATGFGKKFHIHDSGPVIFENNQAVMGGALTTPLHANGAQIILSADFGDIIFNKNMSGGSFRNSIYCQLYAELNISAKKNRSVCFYDPVLAITYTPSPCIFNSSQEHVGTVLFSGLTVPEALKSDKKNYTSLFRNTVNIAHGVVAVEDHAQLHMYKLPASQGTLRLGNGGVLATTSSSLAVYNATLSIPRLAIHLPSVLKENAIPPKIWIYPKNTTPAATPPNPPVYVENTAASITLSGDLLLYDAYNQDPYDSVDLSQPKERVALLYLCDTATPKITNQLNIHAINRTEHYGYQGTWTPYWEQYSSITDSSTPETANTNHKILYADWRPSGYTPNPKYFSPLTTNALWTTVVSLWPYMQNQPSQFHSLQATGQATRLLYKQDSTKDVPGFRMSTKGFWVQASSSSVSNHQLALQLGQTSIHTDEKQTENRLSSKSYAASLRYTSFFFYDWIEATARFSYAYGDHHMFNFFHEDQVTQTANFFTTTLGSSLFATFPILLDRLSLLSFPFVEIRGMQAQLSAFKESGSRSGFLRSFKTDQPLREVSLPIGVLFQPQPADEFIQGTFGFAYQPTLYRCKPKVRTTLLASQGTWCAPGSSISRQEIVANMNIAIVPSSFFQMQIAYEGRVSTSSNCHYIAGGCSLCF